MRTCGCARPRDGRAVFIVGVALGARRTRDGVRSTAYRRTHPMDWSRLHGRARRTFLNGESGGRRAGLPTHWHANAVRVRPMCSAPQHSHLCGCLCAGQCNCDVPSGAFIRTTAAVAKAPPHACDSMFPWVRVGPAVPRSVRCVRSMTRFGGRMDVLSCL